ncbi:hypothetical protein [Neisseria animalis]|uniref:Glycosyltransferase n=1 Tax=Neisseria animalis TaxID=492 RepID=A0A5P3MRI9_NEIAN|nr:hypothetical protein [Neisseria animalis]QEY24226.1 hypothetical protein D0T90_06770 [Neisseria animalis]ROW32165.1 hypothetical protein CGZ60_06215 [Neisseria animalis]VEE06561.1 Uncharacterised protein [Neisseria animalis]
MLPESALKNFYPLIVTPSHDGKYFHNYTLSLLNLIYKAASSDIKIQVLLQRGESLITRARNNAVAEFLSHPEYTHLVWIDSDIGFSPEAFFRLLLADRDVAAGIYPLKKEDWPQEGVAEGTTKEMFNTRYTHYTINTHTANEEGIVELNVDEDGFMQVDEAPTGFMAIKRGVFDKMIAAYPDLAYISDSDYTAPNQTCYRFFDCMVDPDSKRYLSEDYYFCRLWRALGGTVNVDVQSNLTHQGTKVYAGSFARSLQDNLPRAVKSAAGQKMKLSCAAPLRENIRHGE